MTIFEFLDIKYQEVSIALGEEYTVFLDGRAKAIHALIGFYRLISKWISIPILLTECLLFKTHLISEPVSPIKLKQQEAEKAKLEAQALVKPQETVTIQN